MGAKIASVLLCCVATASCATPETTDRSKLNEVKYAVAYCLSESYPESEFSKDAGHVSGAYLQKGDYGIDTYETIRNFVDSYRREPLLSKHDRNLNIMQCIDLYESDSLRALVNKASR